MASRAVSVKRQALVRSARVLNTSSRAHGSKTSEDGNDGIDAVTKLRRRGLIEGCANEDELNSAISRGERPNVYCGFDPTANSLHLGHLTAIIALKWLKTKGHHVTALVGGATGLVGDPSGKSTERPQLSEEEIEGNKARISDVLKRLLGEDTDIVDNRSWFEGMSLLSFLRDVGKEARMGTMLAKESVRSRLGGEGDGMSFTEFSYQLLQAFDFYHLHRSHGVSLQIGGSDQWGNIIAGIDLIKRLDQTGSQQAYGITFPLLLQSDGSKFGKSEGGAVWLNKELLSPYRLYQHIFRTTDADVCRFLRRLTAKPIEEIERKEGEMESGKITPNELQSELAERIVAFVHGEEGLKQALEATEALRPGSESKLDASQLESVAGDCPAISLCFSDVVNATVVDLLLKCDMSTSKSSTRRSIRQGAVRLNNARIDDDTYVLTDDDVLDGRVLLLANGKKNKVLIRVKSREV